MIKKNIKVISVFIFGVVCALGITISAYAVTGKNITFKVNGWNVKNIDEALKYLHSSSCPALAKFTITYDLNGGTGCSNRTYMSGDENFNLCTPTKSGYTFKGWTGSNGTTPQTTVTITTGTEGNKEYTANWVKTPTIGATVTIGGEQFYIIGAEGDNTKLLARYCLNSSGDQSSSNPVDVKFAQTKYFSGKVGSGLQYNNADMSWFYVYDTPSNMSGYMTDYANKVKQAGNYSAVSARPIRMDEYWSKNYWNESGNCTDFWTGSAGTDEKPMYCSNWDCWGTSYNSNASIKPVVLVPTSELD